MVLGMVMLVGPVGATATDDVLIALWNARQLAPGRGLAGAKLTWAAERMLAMGISALVILEIVGTFESVRRTRKWLRRRFRVATVFVPDTGEGSNGHGGVMILTNPKVCKVKGQMTKQIEQRAAACVLRFVGKGWELPICAYHGAFDEDDAVRQLAAVAAWAGQHDGSLVVADANHVACRKAFRPGADPAILLTAGDRALRRITGYSCTCQTCEAQMAEWAGCEKTTLPYRGDIVPGGGITRRGGGSEAQIDIAIQCGRENGNWRVSRVVWAEILGGDRNMSDHALVVWRRELHLHP